MLSRAQLEQLQPERLCPSAVFLELGIGDTHKGPEVCFVDHAADHQLGFMLDLAMVVDVSNDRIETQAHAADSDMWHRTILLGSCGDISDAALPESSVESSFHDQLSMFRCCGKDVEDLERVRMSVIQVIMMAWPTMASNLKCTNLVAALNSGGL